MREMTERYFHFAPIIVGPGVKTGLAITTDNPKEVGADRVVNAIAAFSRYGGPCIVIDFGTATTFNCVNARGEFIGGAIAPGLATSVEALVARAARLYRVELVRPKEAIGRSTATNLQSLGIRRVLYIVPYVAKHREGVPVDQLAKQLDCDREELLSDLELLSLLPLALLQYWRLGHEQRPDDDVATRIVDQFYS